ncbi:hypothetical protein JHK85_005696 [Glycine max]|nr:hypothetical protein JHK85_005696 [Glycine max]
MAILETDIEVDVIDPDTASGKTDPYALQNFQTKAPEVWATVVHNFSTTSVYVTLGLQSTNYDLYTVNGRHGVYQCMARHTNLTSHD